MISGNPIHGQTVVGTARDNQATSQATSGSGNFSNRTVLNASPPNNATPAGSVYQHPASVTEMRSATVFEASVEASPGNGLQLPAHKLVKCQISLQSGYIKVSGVLQQMLLHSSMPFGSSILTKNLDNLRAKEPFDEEIFKESAELLGLDQLTIEKHRLLDKSAKSQLLDTLYLQQKNERAEQQQDAKSQLATLATIRQNFESYANPEEARLVLLSDPVPEHEIAQMKVHVDALGTLLSNIDRGPLGLLAKADGSQQDTLSKVSTVIQECQNILKGTDL